MDQYQKIIKNIQKKINKSKKEVTILFTDIVASSSYWDSRGDLKGRLMIDYHNRLCFPRLRKYNGKVIKTLGDSLMVLFKRPQDAIHAAISIQQVFEIERKNNKDFPRVRIGIHSGRALVEKGDVYGDVVNVAKRIEGRARPSQILVSGRAIWKLPHKSYFLSRKERIVPKGKKHPLTLYACDWKKAPSRDHIVKTRRFHLLSTRQKYLIIFSLFICIFMLVYLFFQYARFFIADSELMALLMLNPLNTLKENLWLTPIILAILAAIFLIIKRAGRVPLLPFKLSRGGLGFTIAFFLSTLLLEILPVSHYLKLDEVLVESKHLFVEINSNNTPIHSNPDSTSLVLRRLPKNLILLRKDFLNAGDLEWNKVLIARKTYGWVVNKLPPKLGVPEKLISTTSRFRFRRRDLYALACGLIGFILGMIRFYLHPA